MTAHKSGLLLLAIASVALLVLLGLAQASLVNPGGFTYPDRWQSNAYISVADLGTNFVPITGLSTLFTDYIAQAQRVDEIWNITTLLGTPFYGEIATFADTHLSTAAVSYYYFNNQTGGFCTAYPSSLSGYLPQDLFSDPSTYVGNTTNHWGGVEYFYNTTVTLGAFDVHIELFVDAERGTPSLLHIFPAAKGYIGDSYLYYSHFQEASGFPSEIFNPPSSCPSSVDSKGLSVHVPRILA
eukprot:TRINITY_DN16663_c0_g1_i1.p1 TRINITY_DN16663_c0_g1~~TRINITY_DN16663_c0_g1_i1.p1  ORF type:complete len:240 (-),score=54.25 TRINITY_DN16663_c0_g1_i1:41-760(-)